MLMKETRPFRFFSLLSLAIAAASLGFMAPVLAEYFETGLVPRMPTWVLAVGLALTALLLAMTGLVLDSVARGRAEQKRILYLAIPPVRQEPRAIKTVRAA